MTRDTLHLSPPPAAPDAHGDPAQLTLTLTTHDDRIVARIDDIAELRCTPTTITLIRPHAAPQRLTVDPEGTIPWGDERATTWIITPRHPAEVLQLDVGTGAAHCRLGPWTGFVAASDRLSLRAWYDDPVDGRWSSGTITASGLRVDDQRSPTWTIAPWSTVWDWTTWVRRYAPIVTDIPAGHGLISDPWCFGLELARIFRRLPVHRCWKLVIIDGRHGIVPLAMETGPALGFFFTAHPNDHAHTRVQL